MQNQEFVHLKYTSYAQPIPLSLLSLNIILNALRGDSSSSSSLFLLPSHIRQLTNTKNKFTLMKVNGDADAIKERKACD